MSILQTIADERLSEARIHNKIITDLRNKLHNKLITKDEYEEQLAKETSVHNTFYESLSMRFSMFSDDDIKEMYDELINSSENSFSVNMLRIFSILNAEMKKRKMA